MLNDEDQLTGSTRYERMMCFEKANQVGDIAVAIAKAETLRQYFCAGLPAMQAEAEVTIDAKGEPLPVVNESGASDDKPIDNVVTLQTAAPEPAPRKPRGPNKVKAAKGKRGRPRKEEAVAAETVAVSDAPIANGSGAHIEAPAPEPEAEQPLAA